MILQGKTRVFAPRLWRLPVLYLCFLTCAAGQAPVFSADNVLNDASFRPSLAPGVIAVILGDNLAVGNCTTSGAPLPTTLCSARLTIGGRPAPLLGASFSQIRFQVPVELEPGVHSAVVTRQGNASAPVALNLKRYAPAILTGISSNELIGSFIRETVSGGDVDFINSENPAQVGDTLTALAIGLGPTDPAVASGSAGDAPSVVLPELGVGCSTAEVLSSRLDPERAGVYRVRFRVPENTPGGRIPVSIRIGGETAKSVPLTMAGAATPSICGLTNAANFASKGTAAAGGIVSVFAVNFGERQDEAAFPKTLVGAVAVRFDGVPAPLFAVSPAAQQVNLLVPSELPGTGDVKVTLSNSAGESPAIRVRLTPLDPGIFRVTDPRDLSNRFAAALIAPAAIGPTAWLPLPAALAAALGIATDCKSNAVAPNALCAQPAAPGDIVQIFATGLGKATPDGDPRGMPLPTGSVAPAAGMPLYRTVATPRITIGGLDSVVSFSGLAPGFAGLYQINAVVPPDTPRGDEIPVTISIGEAVSDSAVIAVERGNP